MFIFSLLYFYIFINIIYKFLNKYLRVIIESTRVKKKSGFSLGSVWVQSGSSLGRLFKKVWLIGRFQTSTQTFHYLLAMAQT